MGFSRRPDRGGFTRGGFQRQHGTGSSASVGFSRVLASPECVHCGRHHVGICRRLTGACLRCGATDHQVKDCPVMRTVVGPTSVGNVSRAQSGPRLGRGGRLELVAPRVSEASVRAQPTAQARTYVVRARDQQEATDVVIGKLSLLYDDMFALIDPGSTHSYVC